MSIFDKIEEAESLDGDGIVEITAGQFLDFIDLWTSCGHLISEIESENNEGATEAIFKVANIYESLGAKYA